jgi:Cof subfamily protein (haloacid dehalogenase superfamily)
VPDGRVLSCTYASLRPVLVVIRLVASDVDGTLLDHQGVLPARRAAAVRRLTASGIPLVLATGKLWTSVRRLIDEFELPGPHIACNGSIVFDATGQIVHQTLLETLVVDEVVDVLRARRIVHAVYLADGTVVTERVDPAHDVLPLLGEPLPVVEERGDRGVVKVLAILPQETEGDLRTVAMNAARVQRTGPRFLEWNARTADKATGLATVTTLLGVALENVMAVGDAENDAPMLRAAGLGVAVAGASPAAVSAADRILTADLADLLDELTAAAPTAARP